MSPYWYCCAWGQKSWAERTGKGIQLQWYKTRSKEELEHVINCGYSIYNWCPLSDIEKIESLTKEVDVKSTTELLQKAALVGTRKIVRQVLETWGCWNLFSKINTSMITIMMMILRLTVITIIIIILFWNS